MDNVIQLHVYYYMYLKSLNVVVVFYNQYLQTRILRKANLVCVYSNSRNDVPRVAQRYGTIAAHTRRRASVLVVFVVFCVHMHRFAGLIRRTPPPTFSDTAITKANLFLLMCFYSTDKKGEKLYRMLF